MSDHIINLINQHDTYYSFSDDQNVWRRGKAQFEEICEFLKHNPLCVPAAIEAWEKVNAGGPAETTLRNKFGSRS